MKIMAARIPDGSTMSSTHVTTFPPIGMSDESRKIHIFP